MANGTAEDVVGQMFKTLVKHVPPPALMPSPPLWATNRRLGIDQTKAWQN